MNLSLLRNTALFADLDETQLSRVADACRTFLATSMF